MIAGHSCLQQQPATMPCTSPALASACSCGTRVLVIKCACVCGSGVAGAAGCSKGKHKLWRHLLNRWCKACQGLHQSWEACQGLAVPSLCRHSPVSESGQAAVCMVNSACRPERNPPMCPQAKQLQNLSMLPAGWQLEWLRETSAATQAARQSDRCAMSWSADCRRLPRWPHQQTSSSFRCAEEAGALIA